MSAVLPHLLGQPYARRILESSLAAGRPASAWLFEGPPGCGKKTAALDLAAALVGGGRAWERIGAGSHPDVRLLGPRGAKFKVEQVRELLQEAALRPFEGRARVFILDKAEQLTDAAANTLLKALEEPPSSLSWILVTTQAASILPTIASRCQAVRFHPLDAASLRAVLERELKLEPERARDLAALSGGDVRQAAFYAGEEGQARLAQAEAFLEAAASGSLLQRLDWAEGAPEDRRSLLALLDLLWLLLRERWVEAKGLPPELRLLRQGPRHGKALPPETLERLMRALVACQAAVAANANLGLALDSLVLAADKEAAA